MHFKTVLKHAGDDGKTSINFSSYPVSLSSFVQSLGVLEFWGSGVFLLVYLFVLILFICLLEKENVVLVSLFTLERWKGR